MVKVHFLDSSTIFAFDYLIISLNLDREIYTTSVWKDFNCHIFHFCMKYYDP